MSTNNFKNSANKLINYTYASPNEIDEWKIKGFNVDKHFASELWDEQGEYVVMSRKPVSFIEYGSEYLLGCEIIDLCPFLGSYGMGGPGYFGFKIKAKDKDIWLVVCIWNADGYMLLDDRVFCVNKQYKKEFKPWYSTLNDFNKSFKKELLEYKIKKLIVNDEKMMLFVEKEGRTRQVNVFKNDNRLSPMGSGIERLNAFDVGSMSDYLMIIYDNTNLFVE